MYTRYHPRGLLPVFHSPPFSYSCLRLSKDVISCADPPLSFTIVATFSHATPVQFWISMVAYPLNVVPPVLRTLDGVVTAVYDSTLVSPVTRLC